MLPFRVQCVTCQARLRVNDPSVVGQVHGCPKCGSMVQLVPPPGWGENAEQQAPADPTPAAAAPEPTPDFAAVGDLGVSLTESSLHESYQPPTPAEPLEEPAAVASAVAGTKWITLAIVGGGVSLFLLTGLVFWLSSGGEPAVANAAAEPAGAETLASEPDEPTEAPAPREQPATETGDESSEQGGAAPVDEATPAVDDPPEAEPTQEELPPVEVVAARHPLPEEPAVEEPGEEPVAAAAPLEMPAAPRQPTPFDPLELDPTNLDLILTRGPTAEAPAEPETPPADDPTGGLDARLASNTGIAAGEPELEIDARLHGIAEDARALVRRGPSGPVEVVADPLSVVVPEVQLAEEPLDRVCRLLGAIAGAPVTLDPVALSFAGLPADRRVSLRGAGDSVEELFEQVLGPLRLEVAHEGHGLMVSRIGAGAPRKAAYRVDDLAPGGDAAALEQTIRDLLPGLRSDLTAKGDRLLLEGPARDHMRVAVLCERLRKARGLEPRSRYPANRLRTTPALAEVQETLGRRTTFNFIDYTPLPEVFDQWRRSTGLVVLVDWAALADLDLTPATTIACGVNDRSWVESLDGVLGELGLAWRAVDGRTIQVTTKGAANADQSVEFYPVGARGAADDLRLLLSEDDAGYYDAPSRTLVVRGGAATQRAVFEAFEQQ